MPDRSPGRPAAVGFVLLLLALLAAGCRPRSVPAVAAPQRPRHVEFVRAMATRDRHALVARFYERNPPDPRAGRWTVNEEALDLSVMVVDPFRGFLRRAERRGGREAPGEPTPPSDEELASAARMFVRTNADLLGLTPVVVMTLLEEVLQDPARADRWVVRFTTSFPAKGYETFLENVVDLDIVLDRMRVVTAVVNRSTIHPRLTLDLRPDLASDDPRVIAKLVGRRVFALLDDGSGVSRDVRQLARLELGAIEPRDVTHVGLLIRVSPGPRLAWITYRLAYIVEVAKPVFPRLLGREAFHFFRYIVDADTGDVVEDSGAPIIAPF